MDFADTFLRDIKEWLSRKEAFAFLNNNISALTLLSSANIIPGKLCTANENVDAETLESVHIDKDNVAKTKTSTLTNLELMQLSIHTPCCGLCKIISEEERHALSTLSNILTSRYFDYESKSKMLECEQQVANKNVMHLERHSREHIIQHLIESMHREECIWNVLNVRTLLFCGPSLQLYDSLIVRYYCAAVSAAYQKNWKLASDNVDKSSNNNLETSVNGKSANALAIVNKEEKAQTLLYMPRGSNTSQWEGKYVRQIFTFLRDGEIDSVKSCPYNLQYIGANTNLRILNMLFSSRKREREYLLGTTQPYVMPTVNRELLKLNGNSWKEELLKTFDDHVIYNISLLLTLYGFEIASICWQTNCHNSDSVSKANGNKSLVLCNNNELGKECRQYCNCEENLHKAISDVFSCRFCGARLPLEELLCGEEPESQNKSNEKSAAATSISEKNGDKGKCQTYLFTISVRNALNSHHHACPWSTFFLQQIMKTEYLSAGEELKSSDRAMDFDFCVKYINQYLWAQEDGAEQSKELKNVFAASDDQKECNEIRDVDKIDNNTTDITTTNISEGKTETTNSFDIEKTASTQQECVNKVTEELEEEESQKQRIQTKPQNELVCSDNHVENEQQLEESIKENNEDINTSINSKAIIENVDNSDEKVSQEFAEEQSDVPLTFHSFHSNRSSFEPSEASTNSHDTCDVSLPINIIRFRFYLSEVQSLLTCWRRSVERESIHTGKRHLQYTSSPLAELVTEMLHSIPAGMHVEHEKGQRKLDKTEVDMNSMNEDILYYHTKIGENCKLSNSLYIDLWDAFNFVYQNSQQNKDVVLSENKSKSTAIKTFVDKGLSILSEERSAKDLLKTENLERFDKEVDKLLFVSERNFTQSTVFTNSHLPELVINVLTETSSAGESFKEQINANDSMGIETYTENLLKEIDNSIRNSDVMHQRRKLNVVETSNTINTDKMIKDKNVISEQTSDELQLPLERPLTLLSQNQSCTNENNYAPVQLQQQLQSQPLLPTQQQTQFAPFAPTSEFYYNNDNSTYVNDSYSSTLAFDRTITSYKQTPQPFEVWHSQNKIEYQQQQQQKPFFQSTHTQKNKSVNVHPAHNINTIITNQNIPNNNSKNLYQTAHLSWQTSEEQQTSLFSSPPALPSSASAFVSQGNAQPFAPYAPQQPFQLFNSMQWQPQEQAQASQPVVFNTFRADNKLNAPQTESVLGSPFNNNSVFADNSHHGILSSPVVSNANPAMNSSVTHSVNVDGNNTFNSTISHNTNQNGNNSRITKSVREEVNRSSTLPQMPMQYSGLLGSPFDEDNINTLVKNNNVGNTSYIGNYNNTADTNAKWGILDNNFNNAGTNFSGSSANTVPASIPTSLPLQNLLPSSALSSSSSPEPSLQSKQLQQSSRNERGRGRGGVYVNNNNNNNNNNNANNVMYEQQQTLNYGRGAAGAVRRGYAVNSGGRANQHHRGNNALPRRNFSRQ